MTSMTAANNGVSSDRFWRVALYTTLVVFAIFLSAASVRDVGD